MTMMLLEWVATSVFLILTVLALRSVFGRRVSARMRYALWAVVLVRLLVPVQLFTSPIAGTHVFTETRTERNVYHVTDEGVKKDGQDGALTLDKPSSPAIAAPNLPQAPSVPDAPEPPSPPDLTKAPVWLGWMWLGGSAALALVLLASNLRFARRLRRCRVPVEGTDCPLRVYAAAGLPSPCLFGLARPAVYVTPEAADPAMLRHVIAHEYTHFRHGDHVWSFLRCVVLAAHWWNPLVWLAVVLSGRDGELACDEGALKRLGDGERLAYGNTLLALVTAKPGPGDLLRCATTMAGDKKSLKERVSRIARAPKRWLWAAVAVVLVTVLACVCAFGQAAESEEPDTPWPYDVSELMYVRDAGGAGGDFSITLRQDGSFTYYEGYLSSYIGTGTWTRDGDVIRLADEIPVHIATVDSAWIRNYYFRQDGSGLIFLAERSSGFLYVDVADGDRFSLKPSDPASEETPAAGQSDLSFSLNEHGLVAITGTALGLPLEPGTYWQPTGSPARSLSMPYEPFTDGLKGYITACWETPASVSITTSMAVPSSALAGYWNFTVDLSGEDAIVTRMEAQTGLEIPEGAEVTMFPTTISDEEAIRAARIAAKLMTAAEDWYRNLSAADALPQTDLNRNGVPETLQVSGTSERMVLEVREDGELIFSEEAYHAHAGYNALFLCTLDGEDYLLRYNPYMGQGDCGYHYKLFTLSEDGKEQAVRENSIEFSINIASPIYDGSFDPEKIAAFMDEINGLLASSVQLINTDAELLATFQEEGQLYDSLYWLGIWEPVFTRDPSKSLLENLRDYWASMEGAENAAYYAVLMGKADFTLRQFGMDSGNGNERSANIADVPAALDPNDSYMKLWNFAVVDMDGDGTNEVLVYGCGASGDMSGYLLLHQMDGRVYGLVLDHTVSAKRWFGNLKTDGTYERWDPTGTDRMSIEKIVTISHFYGFDDLAYASSSNHEEFDSFEVNHQTATKAEFEAVMSAQNAKPDAEWYDFTEENINVVFRS